MGRSPWVLWSEIMKIGNLSKRASILLAVLLLATSVMIGYGSVVVSRLLLNTYSTGTVIASLPTNVTINEGLNWGEVMQGKNYTLTRVLTNTGEATGPLYLLLIRPFLPTPFNVTLTYPYPLLSWDATGKIIPAKGTLTVVFTLQVPANTELGAFNETVAIYD